MKNPFPPFIQINRGRVESVGPALRLYRFPKLRFDLVLCFDWGYPRICITIYDKSALKHLTDEILNTCPRCGSGKTVCPIEAQRPIMLCQDCGLQFNLAHLIRLN
jgi:hypothetical protein